MSEAIEMPGRIAALPRDKHGRPVPWFVAWIDGQPDFRIIRRGGIQEAMKYKLCWVCGQAMGVWSAFTIGPMCAVNRTTAEPPGHRECAVYSARACPFLSTPNMVRRDRHMPEDHVEPAGFSILRNPGVALVWVTRRWSTFPDHEGHLLFNIGEPDQTYWYAHGRDATRAEVLASIESGLPLLQEMASAEGALDELDQQTKLALATVPLT